MADTATLIRQAENTVAGLKNTAPEIAKILLGLRARLREIDDTPQRTPDWKDQQRVSAAEAVRGQLAAIAARVESERTAADSALSGLRPPPSTAEEKLLAEQRLSRAWGRVRPQLDAGLSVYDVATAAASEGDRDAFDAVRAEGPAYLRSQGKDRTIIDAEMALLSDAEVGALSGPEQEGRAVRSKLEEAAYCAEFSVNEALHELDGGTATSLLVTKAERLDVAPKS